MSTTEARIPAFNRTLLDNTTAESQRRFSFRRQSDSPRTDLSETSENLANARSNSLLHDMLHDSVAFPQVGDSLSSTSVPDVVRRARHADSQRSRPMLGSKSMTSLQFKGFRAPQASTSKASQGSTAHTSTSIFRSPGQYRSISSQNSSGPRAADALFAITSTGLNAEDQPDVKPNVVQSTIDARLTPEVSLNAPAQFAYRHSPDNFLPDVTSRHTSASTFNVRLSTFDQARAVSETSLNGLGEEDISMIMMRGATDLRNGKIELEELRQEVKRLHHQLDMTEKEKLELEQHWNSFKTASKKDLKTHSESLNHLQLAMKGLECRAQESFGFAANIRSTLSELADLRTTVSESLKAIEPLMGDNGEFLRASSTRNIITELQMDHSKTQQVADLLRDQLVTVGSELLEARSRISNLEESQRSDREALRVSADSLDNMTLRISELSSCTKEQRVELVDALVSSANNENQLTLLNEQMCSLNMTLERKNAQLEELQGVSDRNFDLQRELDDREVQLQSLKSIKDELVSYKETLQERQAKVDVLTTSLRAQERCGDDLRTRLANSEEQLEHTIEDLQKLRIELAETCTREQASTAVNDDLRIRLSNSEERTTQTNDALQKLRIELAETNGRMQTLLAENERIAVDKQALEHMLETTEKSLADKGTALGQCNDKLQQALLRCQAVEERFDEQSVTLRITKESNGDLQERLVLAETDFARTLEANSGKLNCEIGVLKEQKAFSEMRFADIKRELMLEQENTAAKILDLEKRLLQGQENNESKLKTEVDRARQAEKDLFEAVTAQQSLRDQIYALQVRCELLVKEVEQARQPSTEQETLINDYKARIQLLECCRNELESRARTISVRYSAGDLNDEEKLFINALIQTTESFYEQELIAKGNEMRKRDNMIQAMKSRNKLLESTLARHLNMQARAKAEAGNETRSLIDLDQWLSSQLSSSPAAAPVEQAPDRDAPSTNNDDSATTGRPTPGPHRPEPRIPATIPFLNRNTLVLSTLAKKPPTNIDRGHEDPAPPAPEFVAPKPPITRMTFASLATDGSDDIVDSDDDRRLSPGADLASTEHPPSLSKVIMTRTIGKRSGPSTRSQGKRDRAPSPVTATETHDARPSRRAKVARKSEKQSGDVEAQKTAETAPKARTRKRR